MSKTKKGVLQLEIDYGHCKRMGYSAKELFDFPVKYGYQPYLMNRVGKIKLVNELPNQFIGNVIYLKGY